MLEWRKSYRFFFIILKHSIDCFQSAACSLCVGPLNRVVHTGHLGMISFDSTLTAPTYLPSILSYSAPVSRVSFDGNVYYSRIQCGSHFVCSLGYILIWLFVGVQCRRYTFPVTVEEINIWFQSGQIVNKFLSPRFIPFYCLMTCVRSSNRSHCGLTVKHFSTSSIHGTSSPVQGESNETNSECHNQWKMKILFRSYRTFSWGLSSLRYVAWSPNDANVCLWVCMSYRS